MSCEFCHSSHDHGFFWMFRVSPDDLRLIGMFLYDIADVNERDPDCFHHLYEIIGNENGAEILGESYCRISEHLELFNLIKFHF